jgi:hypothetical protein
MQNRIAFISDNFSRYQSLLRKHSPENLMIDLLTFSEAEARSLSNIFFNLYVIDGSCINKSIPKWIREISGQDYFFRVILISDNPPRKQLLDVLSDRLYAVLTHEQAELALGQFMKSAWQSAITREYDQKAVY